MAINEQSVMGVIRAARPTFRNAHDKVAFVIHSSFLASGFTLHATGPSAFTDDALYSSSTGTQRQMFKFSLFFYYFLFLGLRKEERSKNLIERMGPQLFVVILTLPLIIIGVADEVGIEQWNELDGDYGFVYSNSEKDSKKILVKCVVLNDNLLVDALREGDSEPVHIEIK